jgi:hypothetical protein
MSEGRVGGAVEQATHLRAFVHRAEVRLRLHPHVEETPADPAAVRPEPRTRTGGGQQRETNGPAEPREDMTVQLAYAQSAGEAEGIKQGAPANATASSRSSPAIRPKAARNWRITSLATPNFREG